MSAECAAFALLACAVTGALVRVVSRQRAKIKYLEWMNNRLAADLAQREVELDELRSHFALEQPDWPQAFDFNAMAEDLKPYGGTD